MRKKDEMEKYLEGQIKLHKQLLKEDIEILKKIPDSENYLKRKERQEGLIFIYADILIRYRQMNIKHE